MTSQDGGDLIVITSIAYDLPADTYSLERTATGAGLPATFTLRAELAHDLAAGGGLLVRYPTEVVVQEDLAVVIDAVAYGNYQGLNSPQIDYSARQILFTDPESFDGGLDVDDYLASWDSEDTDGIVPALTITIDGLRNPLNNEASASFEIVTFDRVDDVLYFVDQVVTGLEVDSLCDYPCNTCLASDPTHCLSCLAEAEGSSMPYLQENTCLSACSDGLYPDAEGICQPCDYTCLKCEGSASTCTQCGIGDYLFLDPDARECVTDCPTGYVNDHSENLCLGCRDGCASCDYETTNCTTCTPSGRTPFFFKFDCLAECPALVSIPGGRVCSECDPTCLTCEDSVDKCTSCEAYMRFDTFNNKCLEACLADIQIYDVENEKCETCEEKCSSCVGDVDTCTSCKDGYVLNWD